jgi:phosphatidylserine decarboxylase
LAVSKGDDTVKNPLLQEDLNFLLTNRIPRRWATLLVGRLSKIESPVLTRLSVAIWGLFARDLDLSDTEQTEFASLREVFIRGLRAGARPIDADPNVLVSPVDGIVGAHGRVAGRRALQAKGLDYPLLDLLGSEDLVARHQDGWFVTLRLRSSMYHRLHSPCDGAVRRVTYFSGDTWNVNPIALQRVEQLFCKNERAVVELEATHAPGLVLTVVPVAAILVASIVLHCLGRPLDLRYRGPNVFTCDARYDKGAELGWFELGSTVIVFVSGPVAFADAIAEGHLVRVGEPLFRLTTPATQPKERT